MLSFSNARYPSACGGEGSFSSYTDPKTTIPWYKGTKVGVKKYTGKLDDAIKTVSLLSNNDVTTK